jgi:hypothetical protein
MEAPRENSEVLPAGSVTVAVRNWALVLEAGRAMAKLAVPLASVVTSKVSWFGLAAPRGRT